MDTKSILNMCNTIDFNMTYPSPPISVGSNITLHSLNSRENEFMQSCITLAHVLFSLTPGKREDFVICGEGFSSKMILRKLVGDERAALR